MMVAAIVIAGGSQYTPAADQNPWYNGFEGPNVSWRQAGGDAQYRIQRHERAFGDAHTGASCELVQLRGSNGAFVHISHDVGRPRVIEELLPTVWIKSDRPGIQFLAQIVLPRSVNPTTGQPLVTLVSGSSYTDVGRWQQLRIDELPHLLTRQVRVLRAQFGPQVDGREAYVAAVLLNIYGGPGETNVWIDDLDVSGYAPAPETPITSSGEGIPADAANAAAGPSDPSSPAAKGGPAGSAFREQRRTVGLVGSVLIVEGQPFFPRAIEYRGESLEFLRRLGFNAVWLSRHPSVDPELRKVAEEAERLGLWLVCPPPLPVQTRMSDGTIDERIAMGPADHRVLAWDLGRELAVDRLEATQRWADQVRLADPQRGRPLICQATGELRAYSRQVDLLLIDRRPLGTSLELVDWGTWIRRQPLLARPGTPVWTAIQTQPSDSLREQMAACRPDTLPPVSVSCEQVRLLVYTAIGSGSRGLLFASQSPLDAPDPEARHRAMILELMNLEIQLVEPWAAAGSYVTMADSSEAGVTGAVLRSDHARLLLPVWTTGGAQCVPGQSAVNNLSLVVAGAPESSNVYELTPGELRPLRHKRVTGGTRVILEEFGLSSQVLFAQEPLVVNTLGQRAAAIGPRAAKLQRDLAVRKLHLVRQVLEQVGGQYAAGPEAAQLMSAAIASLQTADQNLAAGDYARAYAHARRAMRPLRSLERGQWEKIIGAAPSPGTIPADLSFGTLPWHAAWADRINASSPGVNRLAGGDFEDLQALLNGGWFHGRRPTTGIHTAADLVADAAHGGFAGVRLTALADDPEHPPSVIETPPVWISSPPVSVQAGQMVCVRGWAHIPAAVTGSVDGLMIVDSIGGESLAARIGRTDGWQPFVLYRIATQSGQVHVDFVLTGLGEVRLDEVSLQILEPPAVTRLPGIVVPAR